MIVTNLLTDIFKLPFILEINPKKKTTNDVGGSSNYNIE